MYCVFLVSVIVLCCVVLCEYRVRVLKQVKPRNIVKMQDESGIDVTGEDSFEEPSTQGPTLSEILRVMREISDNTVAKFEEKFSDNAAKLKEIKDQSDSNVAKLEEKIADNAAKLEEKISNNAAKLQEMLDERFTAHESKCEDRFNRIESHLEAQANKLESLEQKLNHEIGILKNQVEGRCGEIEGNVEKLSQELGRAQAETTENFKIFKIEIQTKLQACDDKVEACCESVTEKIIEVKQEMGEKFNKIGQKLHSEVSHIHEKFAQVGNISEENIREREAKLKREIDRTVLELVKEEIEKERENYPNPNSGGSGLRFSWAPPQNLYFSGKPDENPKVFLDRAENYMNLTKAVPSHLKAKFMQELLKGNASYWISALNPFPQNYEEFREKFLNRYWGEQRRYEFERKILESRWENRHGQSYLDYAMEKISAIKLCDPQANDRKIIWLLTAHFPTYVQNIVNSVECRDLERFQELLAQFDRTRDNYHNENRDRNRRPDGNYQGRPQWHRDNRAGGNEADDRRAPPESRENRGHRDERDGRQNSSRPASTN